jgi:DNA polymerase
VVFGEGDLKARIMFVGEAPGEEEDRLGRPFVGRAGRLLDELMERAGLKRQEVYIANVLKCRPPSNRDPEEDEIDACKEYLFAQIAIIKPKVIVTLGRYALRVLSGGEEKITMVRGSLREHMGSKLVPTYHPSFLLRNERKMVEAIEDIRKARELLLTR